MECTVTDLLKEGDEIQVKVLSIDDGGKIRLSRKAVIMEAPDYDPAAYEGMGEPVGVGEGRGEGRRERGGMPPRGGFRGGDRRGGNGGGRGGGRPPYRGDRS